MGLNGLCHICGTFHGPQTSNLWSVSDHIIFKVCQRQSYQFLKIHSIKVIVVVYKSNFTNILFYSDRETQSQDDEPPQEVEIVGLNQYGLPENIQNDPGDQLRASTFRLKREPYMSMIQRQGFFPKTEPGRDFLSDKPGRDFLEEKRLKRNLLKRFFGEFRDGLLRSRAT